MLWAMNTVCSVEGKVPKVIQPVSPQHSNRLAPITTWSVLTPLPYCGITQPQHHSIITLGIFLYCICYEANSQFQGNGKNNGP